MRYRLFGLCLLSISILNCTGQSLQFYRESLNFELNDSCFYVSGMYFMRNTSNQNINTPIVYPYVYATDSIEGISVYNCNSMLPLETHEGNKSHWFTLQMNASDTAVLHIKYHHRHNKNNVTYILLTTKAWHRPFEQADYTLRVKKGIQVEQLFLPADKSWDEGEYTYYHWERRNYMPKTDFTVKFHL